MNPPEYLGDGVYATTDGYAIEIRLNSHNDPVVVYLEPAVMEKLIAYYQQSKPRPVDEVFKPKKPLRRDAKGNLIPWDEEHDYFMAFDPANPDLPMD